MLLASDTYLRVVNTEHPLILIQLPKYKDPHISLYTSWKRENSVCIITRLKSEALELSKDGFQAIDSTSLLHKLYKGYTPETSTGFIWVDFNIFSSTDVLVLDRLVSTSRVRLVFAKIHTLLKDQLLALGFSFTIYNPMVESRQTIVNLKLKPDWDWKDYITVLIEDNPSDQILVLVPSADYIHQMDIKFGSNVVMMVGSWLKPNRKFTMVINLGLVERTNSTMCLGKIQKLVRQNQIERSNIESLVNDGIVYHLPHTESEPLFIDEGELYSNLILYKSSGLTLSPRLEDLFSYQLEQIPKDSLEVSTRLNYKWEWITKELNLLPVYIIGSLISAYNNNVFIRYTDMLSKLSDRSGVRVLINLYNTMVLNVVPVLVKGEIVWEHTKMEEFSKGLNLDVNYFKDVKTIFSSIGLELSGELSIIKIDSFWSILLDQVDRYYFSFNRKYIPSSLEVDIDNPVVKEVVSKLIDKTIMFESSEYNLFRSQVLDFVPSDYGISTTIIDNLTQFSDPIIYPLLISQSKENPCLSLSFN